MRAPITHHPFSYDLGPVEFTGFGLAIALAFVVAQIISQREIARRGHDPEPIGDLVIAAVVGGLLGGKLYYAVVTGDFTSLFSRAGLVFWGGLAGGIIAGYLMIRWKKLSFVRISDVGGIGIAGAYSVGRTGCWAVGDDYGLPWSGPLAVKFPNGAPPSTAENLATLFGVRLPVGTPPSEVIAVHPTQLYQTAMALGMFLILWRLRDHKHAEGWLFGVFCVLAGLERFIAEFFRAKDDRIYGMLTVAQMIALGFMVAGGLWMWMRREVGEGAEGIYQKSTSEGTRI